jgi:hypothetical protein
MAHGPRWLAPFLVPIALAAAHEGVARAEPRAPLVPSAAAHYPPGAHYKPLCPTPDEHGRRCFGQILVDANENVIRDATSPPGGWGATELAKAYGLPADGGQGTVIATYIGNHYTNAESDVAVYRAKYGLPPCTSANGCFTQVNDSGGTDFSGLTDDGCHGFVGEESLDVTMLQAGCPNCKILVIEGNNHPAAAMTAKAHGAVSMSMSWGYNPESQSDCDSQFTPPSGLALFAASGDAGYTATPGEPGSCTNVIAVGWTQLATDSSARGYADTLPAGWGSAGGCDTNMTKGSWQADPGCSSRMISDISANGDNVAVYCTSPAGSANWMVTGGSSASSPFTTGVLATLGVTGGSFNAAWLYANEQKFSDVTSGGPVQNCPSGSPDYYCNAVSGYDGPTGVGTPYGPMLTTVGGGSSSGSTSSSSGSGSGSGSSSGSTGSSTGSGSGGSSGATSSSGGTSASSSGSGSTSGGTSSGSGSSSGAGSSGTGSGSGSSSGGGAGSGSSSGIGAGSTSGSGSASSSGGGIADFNAGASSGCSCRVRGGTAEDRTGPWAALSAFAALIGFRSRGRRSRGGERRDR